MIRLLPRPTRRPYLLACIGTDWDINLPEHFIRHYLDLGIRPQDFVIALHSDKRDFLEPTLKIFRNYGIEPRRIWRGAYDSIRMVEIKFEMQREFIPRQHWVIHADLDEFHEYPAPLTEFLAERDRRKENVVVSCFIDRLTADGSLPCVQHISQGSIFDQFPYCADVVGLVKEGNIVKFMAYRAYFDPSGGNHDIVRPERTWLRPIRKKKRPKGKGGLTSKTFEERLQLSVRVHHFGWSLDTVEKHRERVRHYRELGYHWAEESQRFLDALDSSGRLQLPHFEP